MYATLSERVLTRLAQAEVCEPNPHYRDDIQIAKLTVLYAANGEAVRCSPLVLASYQVLGLHPDKVWPAIEQRRLALGVEEFLGWNLPPKKPPVPAVGLSQQALWFENTSGAGAINSRAADSKVLREPTISVPMAAPSIAAGYPNSEHAGRTKDRPFFKREELEKFFETCPLDLVSYPEWRTVKGMWIAAGKPFGSEIQFFKAIKHYTKAAPYRSDSTVRANIRKAEDRGFLDVAYRHPTRGNCHHIWIRPRTKTDRGLYRRVTTHRLSIPLLLKWRHRQGPDSQAKVEPIRKPAQAAAEQAAPPATAGTESRKPLRITRDVRIAIAGCYSNARKQGRDANAAIRETCETLSSDTQYLAESEARLQLKIWETKNGSLEPSEPEPTFVPPEKCPTCSTGLVQNRGPGPRLKCPQCSEVST